MEDLIIHNKCGLPLELCVCGGEDDIHAVSEVICDLCGKKWVSVHPPGVPYQDFECAECGKIGFVRLQKIGE